ncbi:MAG TPA: DUF5069 domain-containing protein [Luteolibacter sp.]|nr:DUF5069 domain-containing protein [Luteolibacter sp.]
MASPLFPRSPRETMCGWMYLPRYIDKIRLHLAGRLDEGYRNNFGKGFDAMWLQAAGLTHEAFIEVVRNTLTDGEVADWVRLHVIRDEDAKRQHAAAMLAMPAADDEARLARFATLKQAAGLAHRDDIRSFVDLIDADERRMN